MKHHGRPVITKASKQDEEMIRLAREAAQRSVDNPVNYPRVGLVDINTVLARDDFDLFRRQAMESLDLWPTTENLNYWLDKVASLYLDRAFEAGDDFRLAVQTSKNWKQTED